MSGFRILPGLPPYAAAAISIPSDWGRSAREGLVVEFTADTEEIWVGNFRPGMGGAEDVRQHPNGRDVLVVSAGTAWQVDPNRKEAIEIADGVGDIWPVSEPEGLVMSWQGIGFIRLAASGRIWQARRISWDGLKEVELSATEIRGLAWAPWEPACSPFSVDLRTGSAQGGSYNGPDVSASASLAGPAGEQ